MGRMEELIAGGIVLTIAATTVALRSLPLDQLNWLYDQKIGVFPVIGFYVLGITAILSFLSRSWEAGLIAAMILSAYIAIYHAVGILPVEPVTTRWGQVYHPILPRIMDFLMRYFEIVPLGVLGIAAGFVPKRSGYLS